MVAPAATERLKAGRLHAWGLLDGERLERAAALADRIAGEGLETVRFCFVDQHGLLRGKALTAEAVIGGLADGVAMTSTLLLKDTANRTVFDVWGADAGFGEGVLTGAGDVVMVPDPATFRELPWSPHSAILLCDIVLPGGAPLDLSVRTVLAGSTGKLAAAGYHATIGLEAEFHIFRVVDPRLGEDDAGMPGAPPQVERLDHGYQYLSEARYDVLEPALDDIRRSAEALGLPVRSVETEFGPTQVEFTFAPGTPMDQADAMVLFRHAAKAACRARGLQASFMTRPRVADGVSSGWHIHQSVTETANGTNIFLPDEDGRPGAAASEWIAGLLAHARESCVLTTPTVNGYRRYKPHQLAPDRVQWGHDNKGAMIRALVRPGDPASRVENRSPESAANPYFAITAQILAGLDGLHHGLSAPPPADAPYGGEADMLPTNLGEAIGLFEASGFWRGALGDGFVDWLTRLKRSEWERYLGDVSEWEQREYFSIF